MQSLSATLARLSLDKMNTPITYYGQSTLPASHHLHTERSARAPGQLVSYARMNQIVRRGAETG
jgi:hypothetical protein